jgi:predicted RND superfamily exporter protein
MWQSLSQVILRNRILILSIIVLITGGFAYFASTKLKLDNKYGNMLPKDSPAQRNYLKFKSLFGEDGGTLVFAIQSDKLYTEQNFLKWKELGDKVKAINGVEAVVSEALLVQLNNIKEEKKFEPEIIFVDTTFQEKSIGEIKQIIRSNPLYNNILFNDSANVSLMLISVDESFLSDQKKANVVLDIEKLAKYQNSVLVVH